MLRKRGFLGRYFQVSISLVWLSHCLYLRILEVGDMGGYVTGKYGLKNLLQIKRKGKVKMGGSGAFLRSRPDITSVRNISRRHVLWNTLG